MRIRITQFDKDGVKIQSWQGDMIGGKMSRGLQRSFLEACEIGGQRNGDYFKLNLIEDVTVLDDPKDMTSPYATRVKQKVLRSWFEKEKD